MQLKNDFAICGSNSPPYLQTVWLQLLDPKLQNRHDRGSSTKRFQSDFKLLSFQSQMLNNNVLN